MAATETTFALSPALAHGDILDYTSTTGMKVFKSSVEALEDRFDCSADRLRGFLDDVAQRAKSCGWTHILNIPTNIVTGEESEEAQDEGELIDLIKQYGRLSLKHIQKHVKTYIHGQNRAAQDSYQLAMFLMKSLTIEAKDTVTLFEEDYTFDGVIAGVCLLKVIVSESHIDTNATTKHIRDRLGSLDTFMVQVDSDITKFNRYVKGLLKALRARGQMTQDLLINLFKGYKAASDKEFVKWVIKKEDEYEEDVDINPIKLMKLAQNKYKTRIETGEWNSPTEEEEKIIALEARVQKLSVGKSKTDKTKSTLKKSGKKDATTKRYGRKPRLKPDWMLKEPSKGESWTKSVNGKTYHWCKRHKSWVRHTPTECKGLGHIPKQDDKNKDDVKLEVPPKKKIKFAAEMAELMEQDSDNESN